MTKSERAVAVAKDVLYRIKTNQITALPGTYCNISVPSSKGDSLQKIVNNNTCDVCGIGAAFVSYVGLFNKFDIKYNSPHNTVFFRKEVTSRLSGAFTPRQLSLIECAFEGDDVEYNLVEKEREACVKFYKKNQSPTL